MSQPLSRPVSFRPRLEQLEGRLVPNASRVIDAYGHLHLFVARADGSLTRFDPEGATVLFAGGNSGPRVNWVQAYLDPSGRLGLNVLFSTDVYRAKWVVYDAAGGHDMGTGNILSVSTAFDPAGQKVLDIVQFDPSRGGLGPGYVWVQYDAAGAHLMHNTVSSAGPGAFTADVNSASTAIDARGDRVSDWVFSTSRGEVGFYRLYQWLEDSPSGPVQKSMGETSLFNDPSPAGVQSVLPSFDAAGALVYDVIYRGGEWDYYDAQGAHFMDTGIS
jgi:hypothetical protein